MAGNTRGQKAAEQSNPAPATSDNTAVMAQLTLMTEMMTAMRSDLTTVTLEVEALKATSRPSTPGGQTTTPQITAPQTTSQATQPASQGEDKRWRPDEIGYFDGTGDVFAFTDRLQSTTSQKTVKLVQTHLVSVLRLTAFNWYQYELANVTKWALNSSDSINPWCQALIERFGPTHAELMTQLEACRYTRKDAADKKDATVYIQDIMRIGKGLGWNQQDGLMTAFHHFEAGLQRDLDPPAGLTQFIKQVQLR